jgi:D-glycero-alpha-D-manno-heptose-7-phosphate kinase
VRLAYDMKKELEAGYLHTFGEILDANWNLKRQLSQGISDGQIDAWYDVGMKNGALGGKLLGAGNGGFMMFFAPPHAHAGIEAAIGLRHVRFQFERNGTQIVFCQPAE